MQKHGARDILTALNSPGLKEIRVIKDSIKYFMAFYVYLFTADIHLMVYLFGQGGRHTVDQGK